MSRQRQRQDQNQFSLPFEQAELPLTPQAAAVIHAHLPPAVLPPLILRAEKPSPTWDFETTFPPPLPSAVKAGIFGSDFPTSEQIEALHIEHAHEMLGILDDMAAINRAAENGTDPDTGKRPRTAASRARLEKRLRTAPDNLQANFDVLLAVYADGFGAEATQAFGDWVRGLYLKGSSLPVAEWIDAPGVPVPTPLATAVAKEVFGVDENQDPIEPSPEEVREISLLHGERLVELFQSLETVNKRLAGENTTSRTKLILEKERLTCQVRGMLSLYDEDFGEDAARHLESWARHEMKTNRAFTYWSAPPIAETARSSSRNGVASSDRIDEPPNNRPVPALRFQPVEKSPSVPVIVDAPVLFPVVGFHPEGKTNNGGAMQTETTNTDTPQTTKPTRAEKLDRLHGNVEDALDRLAESLEAGHSERFKAWLTTMSRFHDYSLNNQMLIAFQRPDATHVAGFHAWKKFDRIVNKGEKGIMILAPVTRSITKVDEQDAQGNTTERMIRRLINTKVVYVFDISQTHGEPLPEFAKVTGDAAARLPALKALITSKGIELCFTDRLSGGAQGRSEGGCISCLSNLTTAEEFRTLTHELAHELLHRGERRQETTRRSRELEAESVAFVVCSAIGLVAKECSTDYIHLYRGNKQMLLESLQFIRQVAADILAALIPNSRNE